MCLAHGDHKLGLNGQTDEEFLNADDARRVNALLLTCGAYDAAGDFAYRIGLPVKTGVGGGMVAVVPGIGTMAVCAPERDDKGNSVLGASCCVSKLEGWQLALVYVAVVCAVAWRSQWALRALRKRIQIIIMNAWNAI